MTPDTVGALATFALLVPLVVYQSLRGVYVRLASAGLWLICALICAFVGFLGGVLMFVGAALVTALGVPVIGAAFGWGRSADEIAEGLRQ